VTLRTSWGKRRFIVIAGLSSSFGFGLARTAEASPALETMGPMGGNAGVQGVVSGPGAASTYFNPALLTESEDQLLLGFGVLAERMGVALDQRASGNVPLVVGARDVLGADGLPIPNDTVPTQWLERGCPAGSAAGQCPPPGFSARPRQRDGSSGKTRTYLTLGIVKQIVPDRFTLGAYAMLPISSFTSVRGFYNDEREALFSNSLHPELYGDRLTALSFAVGGAFKLHSTFSVGASLGLSLANSVQSRTYVRDSTAYDKLLLDNSVSTQVDLAPNVGVRWQPSSALRFGGVVRTPSAFKLDTTVNATLPSGTESGTVRHETYHWLPWRVGFGAEVDAIRRGTYTMSITGSLTYAFWSAYEDRHGQDPRIYGADLAWSDTMSGALGVRHLYGRARGYVDLSFTPSPVPAQIGRSNYVDNDRLGLALGGDFEFEVAGKRLRPGLSLFAQRLVSRHVRKDDARIPDELPDDAVLGATRGPVPGAQGLQTNNPGWPGFSSDGFLWGGSVTLAVPL
jgi:long-chain fatty acid transport protein